ncbi:3-deoxy-7-phosphoheptulonate synthase [Patescibacteria group bacterium]|nr:3-deoxy-7-phosphoheptulonate synthase [Patescibacteria group bacterium]
MHNVNIEEIRSIKTPLELIKQLPLVPKVRHNVLWGRKAIRQILSGEDNRLLVIVGPCSIHDPVVGYDYAQRLVELAVRIQDRVLVVMRVYFEKPRTRIGWKGLIHDPELDGSLDMETGFFKARAFLLQVVGLGLPAATEFVDVITPQYIADVVSWAAIGARTAESQTHRQLASGLSMPVGFKNGTGGSIQIAVNGVVAAGSRHGFLSIDGNGQVAQVISQGNQSCHIVLRGSEVRGPNHQAESVAEADRILKKAGVSPRLVVDCSHDNSGKDHTKQAGVFNDVMEQRLTGNTNIVGLMLESYINAGSQTFKVGMEPSQLQRGVSITDACIDWEETEELLLWAYQSLVSTVPGWWNPVVDE